MPDFSITPALLVFAAFEGSRIMPHWRGHFKKELTGLAEA